MGDQPVSRTYPHSPRIEQVIDLDHFGRYAFEATGEQPVGIRLVDRMAGPGPARTGRADRFLDRGTVKAVLNGAENGTGEIGLTVHPFHEQNGADLPRLPERRLVETRLRDYQRRSYWIEVSEPRTIDVEAGGRYLADLRLWREGRWLMAAEPTAAVREPVTGQPLEVRRLHTRLSPGLYRLTAYGGPGKPWSTNADADPLYLRMGIPELPAGAWSTRQASPFGIDRYRLHTDANVFQLELPEARPASLRVAAYDDARSPYEPGGGAGGRIDRDSRNPETTVRTGDAGPGRSRDVLVMVERAPGTEYHLAYLRNAPRYAIPRDTDSAWVGTLALGDPRDAVDATAVIVHDPPGGRPEVKAARAVELSSRKAWRRRFNLLDTVDLLVEIEEDGTYVATIDEDSKASVELRVEPLDRTAARNFRSRWDVASEARWDLVKGFYRISMRPRHGDAGIAEVSLHHAAAPPDSLGAPELVPRQASAVFEGIALSRHDHVLANRYNYGRSGLTVRPWPLTLESPLPVTQSAGRTRRFRVADGRGRTLIAETPAGERLPLSTTENGPGKPSLTVNGRTTAYITNDGAEPVRYLLRWAPGPELPPPPLEPVSGAAVARQLPDFPALAPGRPARLTLERQQKATYRLAVDTPALYRLETTGLLATAGELRTRTVTRLAAGRENGIGRNFLIQRYLGSGDYQLTVNATGRSAGALGVSLERAPLRDAGAIPLTGAVRTTVAPGEAVRYRLDVPETGQYRIRARGLKRPFAVQLAGPDGWPVIRPGRQTPLSLTLHPGQHTLTVLPQSVPSRAVVTVERTDRPAPPLTGHGPHPLPLNRPREHTWMEPADEAAPRTPDRWRFDLAAAMHVRLDLPAEMDAALLRRGDDGDWWPAQADINGSREGWLALDAGAYRLEARSRRPDNRLDYRVRLATQELPLGQQRDIGVPGTVPFVLGGDRLVKIGSLGEGDVAATLLDADGNRIAFGDDRPDDWNFLISRQLPAGRYALAVTAPGDANRTTVTLDAPREVTEDARTPDTDLTVADGDVHVYPLDLPGPDAAPRHGLPLVFASRSGATHGVALERREDDTWRTVATRTGRTVRGGAVLTAGDLDHDYRLRVWTLETAAAGVDVALRLDARDSDAPDGSDPRDWRLTPLDGTNAALGLALAAHPGPLHTAERRDGLLWAGPGGTFREVREGWIPARDRPVWLLAPPGAGTLDAEPVSLVPATVRTIPASSNTTLPLPVGTAGAERLRIWTAASAAHTPELRAYSPGRTVAATASDRSALTVALPGATPVDGGLALRLADGRGDAPVTVSAHALATGDPATVTPGSTQLTLPAGTAVKVTGPAGAADIALTAPAGIAGILARDGAIERLLWTGDNAGTRHTRSNVGTIWLANPGDEAETVALRWASAAGDRQLAPGDYLRLGPTFSGTLSLPVTLPAGAEGRVQVHGAVRGARFVRDDGRTGPAVDGPGSVTVAGPGTLQVTHADAPFGVWLTAPDGSLTGWRHTERLAPRAPSLLSLRASRPTLLALERPDGRTRLHWLDTTAGIDALLPAGRTRLRAMDAAPFVRLTTPTPMPAGLGAPVRLGPGESRAFTFELRQPRTVGLGLKTDRESIRGTLVDARGRQLGDGIAQMHRLGPGRYYLIAHLPRDESPALVRSALVGTQLPDDGPPERVRERYRQLAGKE
ncbi:hypothetical protein [Arhodomonas aquaeolei]|uniref:hypothetical protein n=1 Tax=Arhodomonas aquaeolei TaxID=2369 RepID=UPI00035F74E8|nr:hypothetical protein [Arhodomonas aquaeolei]